MLSMLVPLIHFPKINPCCRADDKRNCQEGACPQEDLHKLKCFFWQSNLLMGKTLKSADFASPLFSLFLSCLQ